MCDIDCVLTYSESVAELLRAVEAGHTKREPITTELGDALIRHPWALHRGTANMTNTLRVLVTIRYIRR